MRRKRKLLSITILSIEMILTALLFVQLLRLNLLELKIYLGILIVLISFILISLLLQAKTSHYLSGVLFSIGMIIIVMVGNVYLYRTLNVLLHITNHNFELSEMSLIAGADISIEFADYECSLGYYCGNSESNMEELVVRVEKELGIEVQTVKYTSIHELIKSLYEDDTQMILFSEAFRSMATVLYPEFENDTQIIRNYILTENIDLNNPIGNRKELSIKDDTSNGIFNIYLSGIDTDRDVMMGAESDANLIVTVNSATKQILVINTPRDFYVQHSHSNGRSDKLTHAGLYGITCSVSAIEELYDIDIRYYIKVNYKGFKELVDAVGGVTVYSDISFESTRGVHFSRGNNHLNGEQALEFARERYIYASDDLQRGKNQQKLIKAILDKIISSSMISNYFGILKAVENNFQTNLPYELAVNALKNLIQNKEDWKIVFVGVTGKAGSEITFYNPVSKTYVRCPDPDEIKAVQQLIMRVFNGEGITDSDYKDLLNKIQ